MTPGSVHSPSVGLVLHVLLDVLTSLVLLAPLGMAGLVMTGMQNKVVDLAAQFTAPALAATVVVTLLAVILRLKVGTMIGSAAALALLVAVAPQWWPTGPKPAADEPVVRLYAANTYYLNDDVAAIARSVQAADADIVVLIELGAEPAGRIEEILANYSHRTISERMDQTRGTSRTLIASKYPLSGTIDPADGVQAVATTAQTPLGPVHVVGAHLTRPWPFVNPWGQISQAMALRDLAARLPGPKVVTGDFNSVSSGRIGRQVRSKIGLHAAAGFPGTWPADLPAPLGVTIDQVYASPELAFRSRRLGLKTGSDHRPVVVEITRARD